jgi:hypothetical protein
MGSLSFVLLVVVLKGRGVSSTERSELAYVRCVTKLAGDLELFHLCVHTCRRCSSRCRQYNVQLQIPKLT